MEVAIVTLGTKLALSVASEVGTKLALPALVKKLASYLGGDVTPAEMKHLSDFVLYEIVALTREASSDDLVQSMPLLEDLQAAALELEDLLDLYEYKQIEKQVSSSSSNCIKEVIAIFLDWLRPILPKSPLRIGLEKLLKFVEQVEKIHPFIKSRTGTTQPHANTITPTASTPSSPYFGRVNQCESIIHFLLDESHADSSRRTNIVPVIAIIGMGGSGKSHTARHIYNDNTIKKHFDAIMWVHVTRDFNVERLTRKIIESATDKPCPNFENFDPLQKELIKSLSKDSKRKRFLLVLDDVWCEDKMKWDLLVGPLNVAPGNGSKIIITTRTENIADNLNATKFCLEDLKTEDCWSVLKHYAFGDSEEIINDQELINVGNQIISKVRHSPLALKVVGSSLRNKIGVNEWEKILKKDALKETMDLLLFSFQCLPSHLQRCFAYCSLFPKGYRFNYEFCDREPRLISLWIAQGFIENTNELTLEKSGMEYIEELLSYSFFEKKYDYFNRCDYFVIHDLLHDLAEKVSKKQCHRIEYHESLHIPTTCIHLSLYITEMAHVAMSNIVDIFKLGNLRSLIILEDDGSTNIFRSIKDLFQNLTKLRALYVTHRQIGILSDHCIDKLKHLRYLQLKYEKKLPGYLTKLYHLQFLILTIDQVICDGYLPANTLPQGFDNLINLRTIQFYDWHFSGWLYELDWLYYNSKMTKLEKQILVQNLKTFRPDCFNGMASLRNLSLCGSLSIKNLENVKCKEEADDAMLNQKKNINQLIFEWSITSNDNSNICEEVLEGLEPHKNLEKLEIRGFEGVRFPKWMVKENWLPRLQTLKLVSCRSIKIVPFLPPGVRELEVLHCDELMQLPPLSDTLHTLILNDCPKLTTPLMFNKSSGLNILELSRLPCLNTLTNLGPTVTSMTIEDCPKLTSLGNLQCCTSLGFLCILKCPMLMREEPSLVEGVVQGDIANCFPQLHSIFTDEPLLVQELAFSSIKSLSLRDCAVLPNLEKLSSLASLSIFDCPDVESLPNLPVSLQSIRIARCPELSEKYGQGGPLHNTISHIPEIDIHRILFRIW